MTRSELLQMAQQVAAHQSHGAFHAVDVLPAPNSSSWAVNVVLSPGVELADPRIPPAVTALESLEGVDHVWVVLASEDGIAD